MFVMSFRFCMLHKACAKQMMHLLYENIEEMIFKNFKVHDYNNESVKSKENVAQLVPKLTLGCGRTINQ